MTDDFETRLTRGLHELVADEDPPAELRDRLLDRIGQPVRRPRRWVPAVAAVVLVALVGVVLAVRDDGGSDRVDLATDPVDTTDADADVDDGTTRTDRAAEPATAPTTAGPAAGAPSPTTAVRDDPASPPTTTTVLRPAPAPPAAPTTTAPPCRNSTDPACGPFRWDPAPTNRPASLTVAPPDGPVVAGESVELTLSMSDPDGPVTLHCYSVSLDGPGLSTGACSQTNPADCPARYGPWTPPKPNPGQGSTTTVVEFAEPGTYVVTVQVGAADGCDQVDPYRSGATTSITVEVSPPPPSTTAQPAAAATASD